jgi:hypothetical protein
MLRGGRRDAGGKRVDVTNLSKLSLIAGYTRNNDLAVR